MAKENPPRLLIDEATIAGRIDEMAQQIVADLGSSFVMVVVLKGAYVFAADLLRALGRHGSQPRVEFLGVSSYGSERTTSGTVVPWTPIPKVDGKSVLIIEDVLDSGLTVTHARDVLAKAGAAAQHVCALLDKPERRQVPLAADYVGFTVGDQFVVGYGIDWAERYRELSYIAVVE
ncbi:MAG TPA: hypoxanthine phosphoribosyltransferase [Magnetospirillaceae bacterium]